MEEAAPESPRTRAPATPAGVRLCAVAELADPGARGFVLQIGEAYFHGFVVRVGGEVAGYVDRCPHAGYPLVQALDAYLTLDGSLIQCAWHGALFERLSGACVGGPCAGARLRAWPVWVQDGAVVTA
jgi:nitrite reductase/ring-hydroxylating ferredoxin subunit